MLWAIFAFLDPNPETQLNQDRAESEILAESSHSQTFFKSWTLELMNQKKIAYILTTVMWKLLAGSGSGKNHSRSGSGQPRIRNEFEVKILIKFYNFST
jgi:hypothetical protein